MPSGRHLLTIVQVVWGGLGGLPPSDQKGLVDFCRKVRRRRDAFRAGDSSRSGIYDFTISYQLFKDRNESQFDGN